MPLRYFWLVKAPEKQWKGGNLLQSFKFKTTLPSKQMANIKYWIFSTNSLDTVKWTLHKTNAGLDVDREAFFWRFFDFSERFKTPVEETSSWGLLHTKALGGKTNKQQRKNFFGDSEANEADKDNQFDDSAFMLNEQKSSNCKN